MIKNKILENLLVLLASKVQPDTYQNQSAEFRNLVTNLQNILVENDKFPANHVLTAEEGVRLENMYKSFKIACLEYTGRFNDEISDILHAVMVPITSFINLFGTIATGNAAGLTLTQVLQNDNLLEGIFTKDKGPADRKEYQPGQLHKGYNNVMEALAEYKELTTGMGQKMNLHFRNVVGGGTNGRDGEIFKAKLALLDEIVRENAPLGKDGKKNPILEDFKLQYIYEKCMQLADSIEANQADARNLYVKSTLETTIDLILNFDEYHGNLNQIFPGEVSVKSKILNEMYKLKLSPNVIGFTEENLEQLQNCSDALSGPMTHGHCLEVSLGLDEERVKEELENQKSPYYRILKSMVTIREKINANLKGKKGAQELKNEDYKEYIAALEEYTDKKKDLFDEKGEYDSMISFGKVGIQQMIAVVPAMKESGDKFLNKLYRMIKKEAWDDVENIGKIRMNQPGAQQKIEKFYNRADQLLRASYITHTDMDHVRLLMMIKSPLNCQKEMDLAKNDLNNIIDVRNRNIKYNKHETDANRAGLPIPMAECRKSASRILLLGTLLNKMRQDNDRIPRALKAAWDNGTMTKEQAADIMDYFHKFEKLLNVESVLSGDYLSEEDLLNTQKLDELADQLVAYKSKPFEYLDIPAETVQALTEESGAWGSSHSPEYQKIRAAMIKLQNLESPLLPDYGAAYPLYKACSDYLLIHSTDHLHFDKAAEVMAKLTIPLLEAMPKKQEGIMKDIRFNMLRCQPYRELLMQKAEAELEKNGKAMEAIAFIRSYGRKCNENDMAIPRHILKGNLKTEEKRRTFLERSESIYREAMTVIEPQRNMPNNNSVQKIENNKQAEAKNTDPVKNMGPVNDAGPVKNMKPVNDAGPVKNMGPVNDAGPGKDKGPANDAEPKKDNRTAKNAVPVKSL